jgi:hypothetical protein
MKSAPKFDGTDWWTWKFRFEMWANSEGVFGFFVGRIQRPEEEGEEQKRWDIRAARVFGELIGALVPDNLVMLLREYGSKRVRSPSGSVAQSPYRPMEAWTRLENFHESQQLSSMLILEKKMTDIKMKPGEQVQAYWSRADTTRYKLLAAGGDKVQELS